MLGFVDEESPWSQIACWAVYFKQIFSTRKQYHGQFIIGRMDCKAHHVLIGHVALIQ